MSREIKFRFWDKTNKEFTRRYSVTGMGELKHPDGQFVHGNESRNIIIEQYTGLKDKNGKDIYEGDILNYVDEGNITDDFTERVYWNEEQGYFCTESSEHVWGEVARLSEVIGDIHRKLVI